MKYQKTQNNSPSPNLNASDLHDHFGRLNFPENDVQQNASNNTENERLDELLDANITEDELMEVIFSQNRNKSGDEDLLIVDVFKASYNQTSDLL